VHEEAVLLLRASNLCPELVRQSARLAELQAAPTLVQGPCFEDYAVVETLATAVVAAATKSSYAIGHAATTTPWA